MSKRILFSEVFIDVLGRRYDSNTTTATVYDKQGRILSVAQNSYIKTHPIQAAFAKRVNNPEAQYLHAEVLAIIRSQKNGTPYKIKIERFFKNGKPALAKPCKICELAIKEAGISRIEYTV